jgi:phosphoribosylaminoimidazole-succinocarboxamide synthase
VHSPTQTTFPSSPSASPRFAAFDRVLACVPYKGGVLNLVSAWWFERTRHIVPNHFVSAPHPNVTVCKRAVPFKVEFVVRAYLTGTTGTSIWVHYNKGSRVYCGHKLPDGMKKNAPLPYVMVTPTTKDDDHDRPIGPEEIVSTGLMTQEEWDTVSSKALGLFTFGQKEAASRGLILVDTKYEFGRDAVTGEIMLIDEVHTPDSSRYWIASSYESRLSSGQEPENIDKEFLRVWFRNHCDPYAPGPLPAAPAELVAELSKRYIQLFETITGGAYPFPPEGATAGSGSGAGATATVDALAAAVAPLFPPAPVVVRVFASRGAGGEGMSSSDAAESLDSSLNTPYSSSTPVPTKVAIEAQGVDILGAPLAAVEVCTANKAGAAGSRGPVAVALVVGDAAVPAASEFVRRQTGLPTVVVGSPSPVSHAVSAATLADAAEFVAALAKTQ